MSRRRIRPNKDRVRLKGRFCVYCGELAQCLDHFPPLSATRLGFLLPACLECNTLAGTAHAFDFDRRARYVTGQIEARYARVLATPQWDEAEIRRLGYTLRKGVESWDQLQRVIRRRIAWSAVVYLGCTALTKDFVRFNAEINTMPGSAQSSFDKLMRSSLQRGVFYPDD